MIDRPDLVTIWASQLAANDFPPVCAMTGQPGEVWRKFRFATPPPGARFLLILVCLGGIGILLYAIVISTISRRATGYLPLTNASRNRLNLYTGIVVALLPLAFILLFTGLVVGSGTDEATLGAISVALVIAGALSFALFVIGALVRSFFGPGATVSDPPLGYTDKLVELRRIHPAFAAAVKQAQLARVAQSPSTN